LAILPALIVRAGGQRFAVPQAHLLEVVRLPSSSPFSPGGSGVPAEGFTFRETPSKTPQPSSPEGRRGREGAHAVEFVHGAPVYRLRGKLLPLVGLARELGLPAADGGEGTVVVLQADGRPFGLIVGDVLDTEEIVVKPLARLFRRLPVYAGATSVGDGHVPHILD